MNPFLGILCVLLLGGVAESKTLLFQPKENKLCPDKQGSCPDGTTCCQLPNQKYGCCPLPNAVCCSDHTHCCPNGYTCDVVKQQCTRGNGDVIEWFTKTKAIPENHRVENVICPDQTSECPDGQTCCQLSSGEWGCCPLPQAVCCNDHEHCCPNGYTCDVSEETCNKENGESIPWSRKVKATTKKLGSVICPDQTSQCGDGQTCCQLSSGQWGCCPLPQAVCCDDHEHCCPNGYTCDVSEETCNKENGESIAWSSKVDATPISTKSDSVICPDQTSECPDGQTCCQLSSGEWGCCPLPQAVCCNDHEHCCPNGYTCDVSEETCNKENGESIPWSRKVKAITKKLGSVICPDQTSQCGDGQTCCQLSSGQWGCCPLPQAVCCNDHEHCCPNGYTCDVSEETCNKENGESIPWSRKVKAITKKLVSVICPDQTSQCGDGQTCCQLSSGQWGCCPLPQAVCCNDHEHCCPNGYTCDVSEETCNKENGESIPWSRKVKAITKKLGSVICPDQTSQCGDGQTCCQLSSGQWGCCPLPQAVCCNDHEHCCPNGYTCDVSEETCNKENGESIPWSRKVKAITKKLGSVICPDQTSQCGDGQTCCQLSSGQWGCCPLPQAVCCNDHEHCCPNGYTCDVSEETCNKENGESIPWSRKVKAITKKLGSVICPDQTSQCGDGQTCCQLSSGQWGCCPLPQAVCCNDHEHCCPNGYTCDVSEETCNKENGESIPWSRKVKAITKKLGSVICPDQTSQCGDGQTCCQLSSGQWGCCPLPQAVCCNDHEHCCPNGYTCDVSEETCNKENGESIPWSRKVKAITKKLGSVICPDQTSQCGDGQTCCQLSSGQWGCCPLPQAVCCDDHEHCCPNGYTCDVSEETCNKENGESIAWSRKVDATPIPTKSDSVICPDQTSECPDGQTCCQLSSGEWGCCPLPQAVCCNDHEHCCPNGYTCDVSEETCNKENGESIPWSRKVKAITKKLGSVICPDQTSQCGDGQTCCQLSSGQWGCCPLPQAVCCDDHEHCCPNGYTCDVSEETCNKENGESIAWSRKIEAIPIPKVLENVICPDQTSQCPDGQTCCQLSSGQWGCCPLPQAVCCDDHEHCCPNGYTCDVAKETCNKGNGESISWSRKVTATPIPKKSDSVICPDQTSKCQDGQTCCKLPSGQWGCCPLPEAVCCEDHEHCCPNGYTCDVPEQKCNKQNGESISWSRKVEATLIERVDGDRPKASRVCPDRSSCFDQYTCCLVGPASYGCCPLPQATCCNDYTHCCPHGYQCDLPRQSCIQEDGLEIQWTVTLPSQSAAPAAQQSLCSDEKSRCQDGSTCCGSQANGRRKCCPYENAVCCSDGLHCCPADTTCNAVSNMCESNLMNMAVSWSLLEKTVGIGFLAATKNEITCPDQQSKCPADTTCCLTQAGFYGCCPYKEATCCEDKLHCCPQGSKCDVEHSTCIFESSGAALPWEMFGRRRAKTIV